LPSWTAPSVHGAAAPRRARLRAAAIMQTLALAAGGSLLYLVFGHRAVGSVVWGLALLGLILALVYPPAHEPLYRLGRTAARGVGWLLSLVLLAPLYFVLFTPVAVAQRLARRDPLNRRWPGGGASYWIARRSAPTSRSYARQFLVEERR
jgi:hypothetical protein